VGIKDNLEGEQVSKLFGSRRWIVIVGITAVLVLAGGGAAYAYFTSSASGTGEASVGADESWSVAPMSSSGTMDPGEGDTTMTFSVTNNSAGDEQYSSETASVNSDPTSGDVTQAGVVQDGCLASWFDTTVQGDANLDANIPSEDAVDITVDVTMSDSGTNQDACENVDPDVTLTIS
jgi:hypothetical protein